MSLRQAAEAYQNTLISRRVAARFAADAAKMLGKDPESVGKWFLSNTLKSGQKVRVWTGRGKQDYHEGVVTAVKLWPKPNDPAFPRDNLTGKVQREDEYTIKFDREAAYEGEPREGTLLVRGMRSGEGAHVSFGKGKERVYKVGLL